MFQLISSANVENNIYETWAAERQQVKADIVRNPTFTTMYLKMAVRANLRMQELYLRRMFQHNHRQRARAHKRNRGTWFKPRKYGYELRIYTEDLERVLKLMRSVNESCLLGASTPARG